MQTARTPLDTLVVKLVIISLVMLLVVPAPAMARQAASVTPVEIDGFPLSLSPDGRWIAGMNGDGHAFCVWDMATLDASCDDGLPDLVEVNSLAWSPDSSAIAFSLGSVNRLMDSDIYVFETSSGTLTNLTDDDPGNTGADKISFLTPPEGVVEIDRFPAWSPDGEELLFARTMWGDLDAPGVTLMTIPREGGAPVERFPLEDAALLSVVGPMWWRDDGSIVFSTRHPDPRDEMNAVWLIDPDGERTRLLEGRAGSGITEPVIADIASDGTTAAVYSRLNMLESLGRLESQIFFHVDLATGTLTPWEEYAGVDLDSDATLVASPAFGPDGQVAFLSRTPNGDMTVWILDGSGEFHDIARIGYQLGRQPAIGTSGVQPTLIWSEDGVLLVILVTGGSLILPGKETASPAATPVATP